MPRAGGAARTSSCRRRSTSRTPASCCRSASCCSPAGSPTRSSRVSDYPRLALTGLVTFFGSLNVAVPFLLDLFRIPADTFQLFLASGVINSRFGTLVAAMHTVTVALLGACAMTGALDLEPPPPRRATPSITAVADDRRRSAARVLLFASVLDQQYTKDQVLAGMHLLQRADAGRRPSHADPARRPSPTAGQLEAIRARGILRVGYLPDALPFAFFNAARAIWSGFDIELAHRLATELGVRLEFLAGRARPTSTSDLARGYCDLVMSGVAVDHRSRAAACCSRTRTSTRRSRFVVPDEARERFATWDDIRSMGADRRSRCRTCRTTSRSCASLVPQADAPADRPTSRRCSRRCRRRSTRSPCRPSAARRGR